MCSLITVNQLIFASINFLVFVFMGIFVTIYFRRLTNWTMQEQGIVCLYRHFRVNLFSRIHFSREYCKKRNRENKLFYSSYFVVRCLDMSRVMRKPVSGISD